MENLWVWLGLNWGPWKHKQRLIKQKLNSQNHIIKHIECIIETRKKNDNYLEKKGRVCNPASHSKQRVPRSKIQENPESKVWNLSSGFSLLSGSELADNGQRGPQKQRLLSFIFSIWESCGLCGSNLFGPLGYVKLRINVYTYPHCTALLLNFIQVKSVKRFLAIFAEIRIRILNSILIKLKFKIYMYIKKLCKQYCIRN